MIKYPRGGNMNFYTGIINQNSPIHQHKYYEVHICISGTGTTYSEDSSVNLKPGTIVITPPDYTHYTETDNNAERIHICGSFDRFFSFGSMKVLSDNSKNEGTKLAKMIYDNRYSNTEYVNSLCIAFAHFILQNLDTDNQLNLAIREISDYISENFSDFNIDLRKILIKSGYAEDYIRNRFKKMTGKTPTEFLTEIRIRHACYLIYTYHNAWSLNELAEKCGYTDYVYFSRRFKQIMGMSPKRYKDMQNT